MYKHTATVVVGWGTYKLMVVRPQIVEDSLFVSIRLLMQERDNDEK